MIFEKIKGIEDKRIYFECLLGKRHKTALWLQGKVRNYSTCTEISNIGRFKKVFIVHGYPLTSIIAGLMGSEID